MINIEAIFKIKPKVFMTHKIHEDIDQKNLFHLLDCVST